MNANEEKINQLSPLDYQRALGKVEVDLEKINKHIVSRRQSIRKMESEDIIQKFLTIRQDPMVQKYLEKNEEVRDLEFKANDLKETKKYLWQHLCNHPGILVTRETIVNGKILNSGICLDCLKNFEELHNEELKDVELLYYKERSENYFLTHEEIMYAMADCTQVKKQIRCSTKKAVRVMNNKRKR